MSSSVSNPSLCLENFREGFFSKTIAITTLTFFAWTFCLAQPAFAVQQELTKEQRAEAAYDAMMEKTPDAKFTYRLQKLKDAVERDIAPAVADREQHAGFFTRGLQTVGLGGNALSGGEQSQLEQLQAAIEEAWQGVDGDLADVEKHLRDKHLDKKIMERQDAAKAKIKGDYKQLISLLTTVNHQKGKGQSKALTELQAFLSKQQFEKTRPKFDPNHLPFGTPKPVTRAPAEDSVALYQLTHKSVQLAATTVTPEMLTGVFGNHGGVAEDLAETIDTTQTQAIKDLAVQLHNNPTEIYTWVANNIRFVPSYGSIQGADMTLQTKRGNAMDTASLLISLLRTAGIPARYAYGTVQMPVDKAMNWVGGVTVPEAAANLMQQGGIPTSLVATNGVITHVKFEHTWVEAWVDYEPSRGMKNVEGDNWIPMDASYKQYDYTQPTVDLKTAVPFDAQGLVNIINQQSTVNEQEGWLQNVPQQAIQDSLTNYQTQLQNYLQTQQPNATVGDVLGLQQTKVLPIRPLAAGLPYQLIVKKTNFSEIADGQRLKFKYELFTSDYGQQGASLLKIEEPTVKLAGQKLALSFKPATQNDENLIASYIPAPDPATGQIDPTALPKSLPGYLIHMVPEFTIGNDVKATTTSQQTMGQELISEMGYYFPATQSWETTENKPIAGQYEAVALDLQGISLQQIAALKTDLEGTKAKLEAQNNTSLTKHSVAGDLLQSVIINWFALNNIMDDVAAKELNVVKYHAPSYGQFQTKLSTHFFFGVPRNVSASGLVMDIDSYLIQASSKDNQFEGTRQFLLGHGARGSAMEGLIPEKMLSTEQSLAHGISAVKAIQLAAAEGQKIYTITKDNVDAALNAIALSPDVENEIRNAAYAGKVITAHEHDISYFGIISAGYIIFDPQTGAGAYLLDSGEDGAYTSGATLASVIVIEVTIADLVSKPGFQGALVVSETWLAGIMALIAGYAAGTALLYNTVWDENEKKCFWGGFIDTLTVAGFAQIAVGGTIGRPFGIISEIIQMISSLGIAFEANSLRECIR